MKKILLITFTFIVSVLSAQVPEGVNYQAVLRNSSGDILMNTAVSLQFIIHKDNATGASVYTETQNLITSINGSINLVIGTGVTSDVFSAIQWSNNSHFLEVFVDVTGGTTYVSLGTQKFMSVPYALHAKTSEVGDNLGSHTATTNLNLNNNNIIGVNKTTTGTIISTAAFTSEHTTPLTGKEGIVLPGVTSDYSISVQDGNGRVQHKWNATHGVGEKFVVGGEDAAFIDMNVFATSDNDAWIEFKHADGAVAVAGDPISWNTHMLLTQGGRIGINESLPDDRLHVTDGGNGTRVRAENTGNGWAGFIAKNTLREMFFGLQGSADANPGEFHIFDNTAGAQRMVIDDLGNVGFGRANPSVKLDVNGAVNCTGGTCSSDIRWKKEVKQIDNALTNIKKLRGVTYFWRTNEFSDKDFTEDKQIGVIAQEVEKVYPELVKTDIDGFKSMDYMSLTAVLLEGIKEQQKEIEVLKSKVNEVEKLKKMLLSMQSQLEAISNKNK